MQDHATYYKLRIINFSDFWDTSCLLFHFSTIESLFRERPKLTINAQSLDHWPYCVPYGIASLYWHHFYEGPNLDVQEIRNFAITLALLALLVVVHKLSYFHKQHLAATCHIFFLLLTRTTFASFQPYKMRFSLHSLLNY